MMNRTFLLSSLFLLMILLSLSSCVETIYRNPPPPLPPSPPSSMDTEIIIFYDLLVPYGDWIRVDPYGWTWMPKIVPIGWRPYTCGHWVYTDYGLTWISRWKWGWAPFHYGRWVYHLHYGWIWIPGHRWGPAWVVWRHGGGWFGWAPLPPQIPWRAEMGLDFGGWDIDLIIEPFSWSFIAEGYLLHRNIQERIIPSARNVTLVRKTKHVTRYVLMDHRVVDRSFSVERIKKAVGHPIPRYRIIDLESSGPPRRHARRKEISMYRPSIKEGPPGQRIKKPTLPKARKELHPEEKRVSRSRSSTQKKGKSPHPSRLLKRQEQEYRRLERQHRKKLAELERLHDRQLKEAMKSRVSLMELRQQQREERKALKEQMKREKELLKKRQEREREKARKKKHEEGKKKEKRRSQHKRTQERIHKK